ncbi:hypothetical protein [Actinomadura oligospora]|uniref:hypothetical protein n=1 Tax=Actinomadura oligospora TaxID=111804 RepID=UPI00047EF4E1|nr:hypothetical protein [Actinomadura oligospora]
MVAMELAVALTAIGVKAVVTDWIRGGAWSRADWALVATQVVDAVVAAPARSDLALQRVERGVQRVERRLDVLGRKIDALPARDQARRFDVHMAAGRRYMRDLPDEWRDDPDRYRLVEHAQHEFVRAFAIAETLGDPSLQALAEVAIAGSWLWVPSLQDVQKAVGAARSVLEQELLFGATRPLDDYANVIRLCKVYGERPKNTRVPGPPTPGARLAVQAKYNRWVGCGDLEVLVARPKPVDARRPISGARAPDGGWMLVPASPTGATPTPSVNVTVRNRRAEWVSVSMTAAAVLVQLPLRNELPDTNRIPPGGTAALTLDAPVQPPPATGPTPTIGFVLPQS